MNAPNAFAENATSTRQPPEGDGTQSPSFICEEVIKRRARCRFMERFEQAFFVGLLLTLIAFTVFIVLSEFSKPSAMAFFPSEVPALTPDDKVRVSWEDEPSFEVPVVSQLEDTETYSVVGADVETTWLSSGEGDGALEANPYIKEEATLEDTLEPVPAPEALMSASTTEVAIPEGGVPMEAYLGQSDDAIVGEAIPGSEEAVVESPAVDEDEDEDEDVADGNPEVVEEEATESPVAVVAPKEPRRIGLLRVGGGHAPDDKVRVSSEDEPTFEVPAVPPLEDTEAYPVVGEDIETTWINNGEGDGALESSPYAKDGVMLECALESVPVPEALERAADTEVAMSEGGVPVDANVGEGESDDARVVEANPGSEEAVAESPAADEDEGVAEGTPEVVEEEAIESPVAVVARKEPRRIGLLRVGGGHARDLKRLYTDPAVVYGLE